jgi:hypothetical protein
VDLERDVPVQDNMAAQLAPVAADAEKLYERIHPFAHHDTDKFDWRVGLTDEQIAATEAGFDAFPQVLAAMEKAQQCTDSAWSLNYEQPADEFIEQALQVSVSMRNFARLHDCRARYLMSIGKVDEAAEMYLRQLKFCRMQDSEPLLVLYLVNTACRAIAVSYLGALLQTHSLSDSTYRAIEAELSRHEGMPGFVHALETEVPVGLGMFRTYPVVGRLGLGMDGYVAYMREQISIGAQYHHQLVGNPMPQVRGIAVTMVPAVDAVREAANRIGAMMRCLRIVNALYAQRHEPSTPIELAQLNLPTEATIDPFSGKPLQLKATEQGWIVYSVGKDGRDDGGKVNDLTDVGFGIP